jgi:hypothetical protein
LPVAARGPVSTAVGADLAAYRVQRDAGDMVAVDRARGLRAVFGRGAVSISSGRASLGLRLVGIGDGGALARVGAVAGVAHGNRVSFAHGGVDEWWANGPAGLEQGFTFARSPAGGGDSLILALRISGTFARR